MTTDEEPEAETEEQDPTTIAADAYDQAVQAIDEAGAASNPADQARGEIEAIEDFATGLAEAVMAGLDESHVSTFCGQMQQQADNATKTAIREQINLATERLAMGDRDGNAQPINAYLDDHLERIDAVRSTDHTQETVYRWTFHDPECEGETETFEIETGGGSTSHYAPPQLQSAILDASGVWVAEPVKPLRDGSAWKNYVGSLISEEATTTTTVGRRTLAVRDLRNVISRKEAYPTIEHMIDYQGIRIDDDPEEGDPSEIWVRSQDVSTIAEKNAITNRALQIELAARGHTADRMGDSVTEETFVNNQWISYWVLDATYADPRVYIDDPQSPMDRIDEQMHDDATQADTTDTDEVVEIDVDGIMAVGGGDGDE